MARAKRKAKKSTDGFPGWLWMLFGLGIGLSVAAAIYFRDVPATQPQPSLVETDEAPQPDSASETAADDPAADDDVEPAESRFDFYRLLRELDIESDEEATVIEPDRKPAAITEAGTYILQVGSFSERDNAERRRGDLGFLGIQSRIERSRNSSGRTLYQVIIGPSKDLDELNLIQSQLYAAGIEALRVTVKE